MRPDFSLELEWPSPVAGIDEAGRGPWAGPVVAAAVILDPKQIPEGIRDSKQLSPARREVLFSKIQETAQVGVGIIEVEEIDRTNILAATLLAMRRAVEALPVTPRHALVDGLQIPPLSCPATPIVKGDGRSLSIAAASIIAKVTRDRHMQALHRAFPHYGWDKNAGYGTKLHQNGLLHFGVTPHHRRSFAPIRRLLEGTYGQA